ncbi:hypothetical protein [Paraburkholderia sp. MM5477-R1]|uniref:hypothetical protein n=1 Tax=Paraburkholderia sp. MM5477-R1 TaxID=2991062 RepID=UPI003D1D702B
MASAGSLIFELAADVSRLRTDMQKAQTEIKSSLDTIAKATSASAVLAGAQWAQGFAQGFADKIKAAIDNADALGKLSQRIGTTTEALSALQYAGAFAGVTTDDLTTAFKGLNKALLEARDPLSDSAAAIKALGLDVNTLRNEDPAKAFEDIAEAMSQFKDGAEKAAVATQLFGKQGQALIPLLDGGRDGLIAARQEAESLGLIISGTTAQAMADLNDDLTRLHNATEGAFAIIAQQLTPAIDTLVRSITQAHQEGDVWHQVLVGIGTIISDLILDVASLAGEIAIAWKELQGYGAAAKQFFAGDFKAALDTARSAMDESNASMDELTGRMTKAKALQREMADNPLDLGNPTAGWDEKPVVKFTATLDANAAAGKRAKQGVDEYAQMLQTLSEQLRKAAADGDAMQELLTDPKFQKFTKVQQAQLVELQQAYQTLTAAQQQQKQAQENEQKARDDADKALIQQRESLKDFAATQLDAIDPTRAYIRTVEELQQALADQLMTADQVAAATEAAAKRMTDAIQKTDPMKDQLKSIQQAIEGFGKKSSDALVDFVFSTKDASVSFSEMVTSMLKDIAKLLVYKNVFEPLVSSISGGMSGGGWMSSLAGIFGGARMAGGFVSPGQFYRVNETPLHAEYFAPNVPGKVVTGDTSGGGVTVNVNINRNSESEDSKGDDQKALELGKRISAVVRQVIATEKRTGGMLAS